jgi:predicted amino acid dehydrogenase
MIDVRIHTTDPMHRDVIKRYWALSSGRQFEEEVSEIAADYGLTWGQILSIVNSSSTVVSTVHRCVRCHRSKVFTCRKDFRKTRMHKPYVCDACRSKDGKGDEAAAPLHDSPLTADQLRYESRILRTQVRRVTEALSDVSEQLNDVREELHGIRHSLDQQA